MRSGYHDGGVELAAGLDDAGEGDVLTIAKEVFARDYLLGFGLGLGVEVDYAQTFGIDGAVVEKYVRADTLVGVDGRGCDDVVAPGAVRDEARDVILHVALLDAAVGSHAVRRRHAGVALVILQTVEVLVAPEEPRGSGAGLQAVVHGSDAARVEVAGLHDTVDVGRRGDDGVVVEGRDAGAGGDAGRVGDGGRCGRRGVDGVVGARGEGAGQRQRGRQREEGKGFVHSV